MTRDFILARLNRIERDIVVHKRVRRQMRERSESTAEIDGRLDSLRTIAKTLRGYLEQAEEAYKWLALSDPTSR